MILIHNHYRISRLLFILLDLVSSDQGRHKKAASFSDYKLHVCSQELKLKEDHKCKKMY